MLHIIRHYYFCIMCFINGNDSNYILNDQRTYLNFNSNVGDTNGLLLITIDRQKRKKNIIYNKTNFSKSNLYYFDSKILKTDTLLIKLKSKIFKIYDFESKGGIVKEGENRNSYYCDFYFKINSNEQIITGDTIYISNK